MELVRHCDIGQQNKSDSMLPARLLQPLPIPDRVWSDVYINFVKSLLSSGGFMVVMEVVDRLTKNAHFTHLSHPYTVTMVTTASIANIVRLHGIPTSIVCDRDKKFISAFWRAFFQFHSTKLCMSSSYYHQTNGQTEVVNRTLEQYLRCFTSCQPRRWKDWLPWVDYSYNTYMHSSTWVSPFEVVYGQSPPSLLTYIIGTSRVEAVDSYLRDQDAILCYLRANLLQARDQMVTYANKHHREVHFNIGDFVYLKLQPYRQTSVAFRASLKLAPWFYGLYEILERVRLVAYRLALPSDSCIHNVFHVSLLQKHFGVMLPVTPQLPPTSPLIPCYHNQKQYLIVEQFKKGDIIQSLKFWLNGKALLFRMPLGRMPDVFLGCILTSSLQTRNFEEGGNCCAYISHAARLRASSWDAACIRATWGWPRLKLSC